MDLDQQANVTLKLLGYVVSKFKQRRTFQVAYLKQIREMLGDQVFDTVIPDLAQFERSVDNSIPTTLLSPPLMPFKSLANSLTRSNPVSRSAAPRKNTTESASQAAKAALERTPKLSLGGDHSATSRPPSCEYDAA